MKKLQPMEDVYREYAMGVYRYLLSLCRSHDTAEELTQETFYQAIKSSGRYDESYKVSTWLYAIARNVFLVYLRKNRPAEDIDEQEIAVGSAESEALSEYSKNALLRRINELPEPHREIMNMRVFGGLSFKQIGEAFGKSENWARVNFYRCKEKLRKEMRENEC